MKKLFLGNFHFEHHLATPGEWQPPESIRRLNAEFACVWVAIAAEGDFLWLPEVVDPGWFEEIAAAGLPRVQPVSDEREIKEPVEVVPWGWTDPVRRWAKTHGWQVTAPAQQAVERANSRRWSLELEKETGTALPGSVLIDSVEALKKSLPRLPAGCDRWVLKAKFGMSARERWTGRGRTLSAEGANWAQKRIGRDGCVVLEPCVERLAEAGIQFTVPRTGGVKLVGVTPLLTDASGVYRGSRFSDEPGLSTEWAAAVEAGLQAAERVQRLGYFGPLGIDAVRYRGFDGMVRIRPLQDINTRYTMGRVSLGFRKLFQPGECGTWLHLRWPHDSVEAYRGFLSAAQQRLPAGIRLIATSPWVVGGRPTQHGTLVVIAPTAAARQEAEEVFVESRS